MSFVKKRKYIYIKYWLKPGTKLISSLYRAKRNCLTISRGQNFSQISRSFRYIGGNGDPPLCQIGDKFVPILSPVCPRHPEQMFENLPFPSDTSRKTARGQKGTNLSPFCPLLSLLSPNHRTCVCLTEKWSNLCSIFCQSGGTTPNFAKK